MRFCPECLDSWLAFSFTPVPPWTAPPRCYIGSALSFQRSEQFRLCSERQRPLSVFCRDPLSVAGGEVGATVEVGDPPEVRSHRYETCQTLCRPFKFCYVSHTVFMPPSWGNHSPKSPPPPTFLREAQQCLRQHRPLAHGLCFRPAPPPEGGGQGTRGFLSPQTRGPAQSWGGGGAS